MSASTRFPRVFVLGALLAGCLEDPADPMDAGDAGKGQATDAAAALDASDAALDAGPPQQLDAAELEAGMVAADAASVRDADTAPSADAAPAADAAADTSLPADEGGAPGCATCCADGLPRGAPAEEARKVASLSPSPEGVAVCPGGELFVALDGAGEIWRVPLGGGIPERWAVLGDRRPAGLACDEHGRLFAATFTSRSGAEIPIEVLMVTGKDAAPVAMPQPSQGDVLAGLNGIVAAPGLGVFASDSLSHRIVLVRETAPGRFETHVVASDVSLANGLAYHPQKRELYAAASGAFTVLAFRVGADGALTERRDVPVRGLLLFADGVAVDAAGELYIADYLRSAVIRASDGQAVAEVPSSASLAFRGGTLFITSYDVLDQQADGALYALDLGVCGP